MKPLYEGNFLVQVIEPSDYHYTRISFIILHELCVSYPRRIGCIEKSIHLR